MKWIACAWCLVALLETASAQIFTRTIDFNNRSDGTYTPTMMKADWLPPSWASWDNGLAEGRGKIVAGAAGAGKALEVTYPQGKVGPSTGGVQFNGSVRSSDEMWAEYRLMFKTGFNFVKGGKLPGLCGGKCNSGGEKPTGTDGWSARYMFRDGGKAVLYLYHMDQPTEFGEDIFIRPGGSQLYFQPGKWYTLTQRIKLNTPGYRDGIVQVWVDGKLALDLKDIRYRTTQNLKVDAFFFSTFFGGSGTDWAPVKTEYAQFDDFRLQQSSPLSTTGPTQGRSFFVKQRGSNTGRLHDLRGRAIAGSGVAARRARGGIVVVNSGTRPELSLMAR